MTYENETSGIAVSMNSLLERTIGENGSIVQKQTNLTKQAGDIDTQIADMEKLVQTDIDHWKAQFVAMEQAQQTINQQLSYLNRQFPG